MKYVIMKASRYYRGGPGYMGPTCDMAGVAPARIYNSYEDAMADAKRLNAYNPVGFLVEEYKDYQPED